MNQATTRSTKQTKLDHHGDRGSGDVRSVRRALQLLTLFDTARPKATLSDLARESGLATTTVQRLLQTLEREGFVLREPDGFYALGTVAVRLGLSSLQSRPLYDRAGPWLERLSARTSETANLAVRDTEGRAVYLRQSVSRQAIRHENWLGRPFDCRHTAVGRALAGKVDTEGGYTTRLTQALDVSAAAAPVHAAEGDIVAALSITAPTYRTDDARLEQLRLEVVAVARELSEALGNHWPYRLPGKRIPPTG